MKKLSTSFGQYSEPNFLTKVQFIVTSLTGNANFPAPYATGVPSLTDLGDAVDAYQNKYNLAAGGDRTRITERNAARAAVVLILQQLAPYLESVAGGDQAKLESTGYDVQKGHGTPAPGTLPGPQNVKLKNDATSGRMLMGCSSVKTATAYESQLGTDPNNEATFTMKVTTSHCTHIAFEGLTPGVVYYGRMRAIGPNGPGGWSDIVQLRAA